MTPPVKGAHALLCAPLLAVGLAALAWLSLLHDWAAAYKTQIRQRHAGSDSAHGGGEATAEGAAAGTAGAALGFPGLAP